VLGSGHLVAFAADPEKLAKLKGSNMGSGMRICCFCHNSITAKSKAAIDL
jgi:hypothetical protein